MADNSKKDKLLEEGQKLVARGQFDKAAKVYEQLVALEPSAINQRQKLAEILIKAGRSADARKEFEAIGSHFSNNGFYLKAIAVYKQLQKFFPTDIAISLTLARLNEKHGLTANALSEYKQVYDYYEKDGNVPEALLILDKMQNVDPQNITIKIKLAEACFQCGKKEDTYTIFSRAASLLQERGDSAGVSKLNARILELFPDKSEFMLELFAGQVMSGNAAGAVNGLQGILRGNPNNRRAWDTIIEAFRRLDQPQKVKVAYKHYIKMLPDESAAMAGLMFCSVAERDVTGTLELLNLYEKNLLSAGMLADLEKLYRALIEIDPVNVNVLEGLIRVVKAAGNESEVNLLSDRLGSLSRVSGKSAPEPIFQASEPTLQNYADFRSPAETVAPVSFELRSDGADVLSSVEPDAVLTDFSAFEAEEELLEAEELTLPLDDDIEIELDIDDDSVFGSPDKEVVGEILDNNDWMDSVSELFDKITTAPSGVKYGSEMETSDARSHYDLGLAFKEMGLYDEAINEFRKASSDSDRRMACLIMQGACLRERGEYDTAINMLNTLLKPGLSLEDSSAAKYELALAYDAVGNTDESTRLLSEIDFINHDFRDVSSRLNASNSDNPLDFSDDDLNNF